MTTDKIYVGDIGTEIVLDLGINVSGASTLNMKVKKPSGVVVTWTAVVDGGTLIKHVCEAGDLDRAGIYLIQAFVAIGGFSGHSVTVEVPVYDRFK
jgi:hypothetical protein